MAKDPLLRDAVKALKQKIQTAADSASPAALPTELAYLSAATEPDVPASTAPAGGPRCWKWKKWAM